MQFMTLPVNSAVNLQTFRFDIAAMASADAAVFGLSTDSLKGYIMIIAVALSTAGLTETTEIAEAHFDFPFIMRYICS